MENNEVKCNKCGAKLGEEDRFCPECGHSNENNKQEGVKSNLKSNAVSKIKEFVALDGENILTQIEGDAWNSSPNPIAQLMAVVFKKLSAILGVKLRTYIIVTNMRIVQIDKKTFFWGLLPGSVQVLTLNKATVQTVGYEMASSWFIFRKYYFLLKNMSGEVRITYKGKTDDLVQACRIIDKAISQR